VGILFGVGLSVRNHDATLGATLIAIAVGTILLVSAASLATQQVFSVALYRYANGAPDTRVLPPPTSKNRSVTAAAVDWHPAHLSRRPTVGRTPA
jgi:hypothetical protein